MMIQQALAANALATAGNAQSASSQTGVAAGNGSSSAASNGGGMFGNTLVQLLNGGNSASSSTEALTLNSLLQGLSPELLAALLGTGQQSVDGSALPKELTELLADQPELLDSLLESDDFQRWLSQAAELLQGMQLLPQLTKTVEPQTETAGATVAANGEMSARFTQAQSQAIVSAFVAAASTQKDSVLMQQLNEDLANLLKPLMEGSLSQSQSQPQQGPLLQQATDNGTGSQRNASAKSFAFGSKTAAAVSNQALFQAPAASAYVYQELMTKLQSVATSGSVAAKLEMLAAKSGLTDRFASLHAATETVDSSASAATENFEANNSTVSSLQTQDLLKAAQHKHAAPQTQVSAESFVSDMSRFVLNSFKVSTLNGLTEARLSMTPETLGHVDVKIAMQNGQLVAQFAAQTATGKEMIEGQLAQLRAALQQQGIQVERLEVVQQSGQLASGMFQEQRHQQSSSQQFTRSNKGNYVEEDQDDFSAEMVQVIRNGAQAADGGFDVTA